MGSVVFSDAYNQDYIGDGRYNVKVNYSENYDSSQNKTTVAITGLAIQKLDNSANYSSMPVFGKIQVAGTDLMTLNGSPVYVSMDGTSYCSVTGLPASDTVKVSHNTDGTAVAAFQLISGNTMNNITAFGAFLLRAVFGATGNPTLSVNLTPHTSTLTVDPHGGTWGGSTSPQTFQQAPTSTKTIANPTRTGYTFAGWTKSGGGTLTGTTYTFGASDGTLTAKWTINSYTVTCEDRVGGPSGALLGTNTASYNYGSSASGASFGSSTTYDAYYTGYHYTGSSAVKTVTEDTTVYRYFALNTWTVSYNSNGGSSTPVNQTKTYNVALPLAGAIARANSSPGSYTVTYNYNGNGKANTTASSTRTTTYTFSKWKDSNGNTYNAGANYTTNAAATMAAQWTSSTTAAAVTLPSASWEGHTFKGWYTAASGGTRVGGSGGSYTPSGNVTLYAQWEINTFLFTATAGSNVATVSLNGSAPANYAEETVNYGSTNTFVAVLESDPAFNYTFQGWYRQSVPNTPASTDLTYTFTASANRYLTAKATRAAKSYTLSLVKPNTGGSAMVRRTDSPNGGGNIGTLNDGATIYYGDVLEVSYTENPGYEVDKHTIDGVEFTSPATITVVGDVSVEVTMKNSGVVWIWNGSSWVKYIPYIWNGSAWVRYIPYIWTGSAWEVY